MTRIIVLALALVGVTGVAYAQPAHECSRHKVALTDEYGFRYDAQGDRLNGAGCIIPPPHTKPGAHVIQN
jgi:hypothetical protein